MTPAPSFIARFKNRWSKKRENTVPPQPAVSRQDASNPASNVSTVGTTTATVAADAPLDHGELTTGERLWNEAYESLKNQDTELVAAYEKVLSRELVAPSGPGTGQTIDSKDP
ncbi:hypothetical protein BJX66DRAFT_319087 [Aspergillus keveii]|uniref:NWD NACHT-NTPase N-terminal domain-containing protein n=1 Tax=Aspergillus keveii TaxID=714993 RepID=A0ABR4FIR7_9EURO